MSEVVELKKPKKAATAKKKAAKKVARKVISVVEEPVVQTKVTVSPVESVEEQPIEQDIDRTEWAQSPGPEEKVAAYYAAQPQPIKYGFFERQYDNLRFWLGEVYKRVPRIVWVGQRINIDVRWDQAAGRITTHYAGNVKKAK